jgi:hypothetical protein
VLPHLLPLGWEHTNLQSYKHHTILALFYA